MKVGGLRVGSLILDILAGGLTNPDLLFIIPVFSDLLVEKLAAFLAQ